MKKITKTALLSGILALSFGIYNTARAYTPPFLNDANYEKGIISLGSNDYSDAIFELNQALMKYPNTIEIKNNLADAYYRRGMDFYSARELKKASIDLRAAVFYLKYFQNPNAIDLEKVSIIENNLSNCIVAQGLSPNPKSRFNEAKKLRGQGLFPQAAVEFIEASKDPSVRALALENVAELFSIMNQNKQALPYYQNALALAPLNYDLHLRYARALEKTGITDKAIEEYNLAFIDNENAEEIMPALERLAILNLQKYPNNTSSYLNLGAVYQRKGDFDSALANYQKAQVMDASNPAIKINIGSLYQAQGNYEKALGLYNEVIMSYPQEKLAYLYKARVSNQMKEYTDAINNYKEVLKLDPKDSLAKQEMFETISNNLSETMAYSYFETMMEQFPNDQELLGLYADALLKKGHYTKATLQYQKLLAQDSSNTAAYIGESQAYQGLYDFDNALKVIDDGIAKNPDDKKLPAYKAEVLENKDVLLYKQAFEFYNKGNIIKALETYKLIKTPSKDIYINIGACYQRLGKYPEAFQNYNLALVEEPNDIETLVYLGNICCLQKQFEKANTYYKKALLIEPENQTVQDAIKLANKDYNSQLLEQGMAQYKAMDYKKSLKTLSQLITFDPQNAYGYYYRALCYDGLNDSRKAIEDYVNVTKFMPKMDIAYYSLGVDYDTIADYKSAKESYKKFIELSGTKDTEYTKYAKKRLIDLKNTK
jgi:tetratricopeptide (TPR) repeat protein